MAPYPAMVATDVEVRASRRTLLADSGGLAVGAVGFGLVYGLAAREAGFSPIEAVAMSAIAYAGAAQFAAVGYVAGGLAWAVMAHLVTDESYALSISHFRRIGRTDERGYWLAAIGPDGIFTWILATRS